MQQAQELFNWLFGTMQGVLCLIGSGMLFFFILAFLLERKTHKLYFHHPEKEDEESYLDSLFNSDKNEINSDKNETEEKDSSTSK